MDNTLAITALVGTGVIGAIILFLRQTILAYFSAKNQVVAANAQDNIITRLEAEIKRLETAIVNQEKAYREELRLLTEQVIRLEERIEETERLEKLDVADLTTLSMLFEITCGTCQIDLTRKQRIEHLIESIRARRLQ